MCVIDRRKEERAGLLSVYGSLDVFERARLRLCSALHTQRTVSQTNRIHQGPTELALGPVELLTSEATSRDMQPTEGGPRGGAGVVVVVVVLRRGGAGSGCGCVEVKGGTSGGWFCHILELLST